MDDVGGGFGVRRWVWVWGGRYGYDRCDVGGCGDHPTTKGQI